MFQRSFHSTPRPWTQLLLSRSASTSSNPLPFPAHPDPTPQQIFHLPITASQKDIKKRYYDLVRIYHPDSPISRVVGPEVAHARFQAIGSAYNVLRGKSPQAVGEEPRPQYNDLNTAMWKARQRQRAELNFGMDERWKERLLVGTMLLTIAAFVAQTFATRRQALAEAVKEAKAQPVTSPMVLQGSRHRRDEERLTAPDGDVQ
ncbi:hypothetical protein JAAARDRAFT_39205 [Jaapia argillacea MUCL 33604]|uniref:J domain-containing protein n=1 Tax=Jaapia argillacea MUCL 33604 TaxID=933084 RepID=A0A067PF41_9AGAM|nr:hypothetical protein JAAARDRAFT_39205 [Jaapia argillacea MUCL 33604]